MTSSWGPVEKPVEHNVKPIAADGGEGAVTQHDEHGSQSGRNENYNATDGRHNRADHQGWPSIDGNSGCGAEGDFIASERFHDGPGPWRQT